MMARERRLAGLRRRVERYRRAEALLSRLRDRLGWARLSLFGGAVIMIPLLWYDDSIGWTVLLSILALFAALSAIHQRSDNRYRKVGIMREMRERQLAQMNLDWAQIPEPGTTNAQSRDHPFRLDLEITGGRSLHHLLDMSITPEGGALLATWLLEQEPDIGESRRRQELVRELRRLSGFRDGVLQTLYQMGDRSFRGAAFTLLLDQARAGRPLIALLIAGTVLVVMNYGLLILYFSAAWAPWWVVSLSIYVLLILIGQSAFRRAAGDALDLEEEWLNFIQILRFLESYPYPRAPRLRALCRDFVDQEARPSRRMRRIRRILFALGLRMNPGMGILLNLALPWDFYFAWRLDRAKEPLRRDLPRWLETWTQLEALISLANHAWLNPDHVFPKLLDASGHPKLEAAGLGHPLIVRESRVCNDVRIDTALPLLLITGSNMSGKSTFLKTLGINIVLAAAGAPVVAQEMSLTPWRLRTCIRVMDSVTDGFSYFYAEVRRLKRIMNDIAVEGQYPVFYLIDEIFKGTNNRERYIGSRSYITALSSFRALGAVSTHDLELTRLEGAVPGLRNFHFREAVQENRLIFDYELRSGPSPTTNALKIMRMEGLPVDEADE